MRALRLALCAAAGAAAADKPHIVIIVADDLGHGDLGYTGTSEIKTPEIDALAARGRVLTDYYVQPSCSPTRASIHTGRYVMRYNVNVAFAVGPLGVNLNETFISEVLKRQGYRTHAVGKWHLGQHAWEFTPTYRGYETFLGFLGGGEAYFTHTVPWFGPKAVQSYDFRRQTSPACGDGCSTVEVNANNHYSTHLFTAEAVKVIGAHDVSEPLFLYLAYQAVHGPDQAPEAYVEPYFPGIAAGGKPTLRQVYGGMLAALDEGVGNVTAALRGKKMWDNTFLAFTADNGGPTDMCMKQGSTNAPYRGGKCSIWEGGTRAAAFVSGGAKSAALTGSTADAARTEVFYGFSGGNRSGAALRTSKWKLLRGQPYNGAPVPFPSIFTPNYTATLGAPDELGFVFDVVPAHLRCAAEQALLFDLTAGVAEQDADNVAAQNPDVVEELGARLDAYVAQAWTPEKGPDPAKSAQCGRQPKNKDGPDGYNAITPYCKL